MSTDLFEYAKNAEVSKKDEKPAAAQETVVTVSQITTEIKQLLLTHFQAKTTFWVKGEVSGFRGRNQAGHIYFKLKDENAVLSAVFFRFSNQKSKVELKEGQSIFARGKIDVYEKSGSYQLIIDEVRVDGTGDLYLKFEQLKKKLQEEGLFSPEHKKPLPKFPTTIGVITSSTGAVVRDIIHVIRNRYPMIKILLFPVKVQGDGAAEDIVEAIGRAHRHSAPIDVLIVGRGGGSIEDLWPFNEEIVARAIYNCTIPIVSAVGHQTDFTIADFVADVRAATPSQAAEMIVPSKAELQSSISQIMKHIIREISLRKEVLRGKLNAFLRSPVLVNPRNLVYQKAQRFDYAFESFRDLVARYKDEKRDHFDRIQEKFLLNMKEACKQERMQLEKVQSNLQLVNPTAVLSRGFSIVEKKNKEIVRESGQVEVKEEVTIHLHQGTLECQILKN
jgi:exodeoxyribonuclease VII large subunit